MQDCTGIGSGVRVVETSSRLDPIFVNVNCSQQRSQRTVCTSSHSTPTPLRMHSTIVKQHGQSNPSAPLARTAGERVASDEAEHAVKASARTANDEMAANRRMRRLSAARLRGLQQFTARSHP